MSQFKVLTRDDRTGELVAIEDLPQIICPKHIIQSVPSKTWTINHNADTINFFYQCFSIDEVDGLNKLIEPGSVTIVDSNTFILNFTKELIGFANVILYTTVDKCVSR